MYFRLTDLPELQHLTPDERCALIRRSLGRRIHARLVARAAVIGTELFTLLALVLWLLSVTAWPLGLTLWLTTIAATYIVILTRIRGRLRLYLEAHRQHARLPMCLNCGYALEGTQGETCPECGASVAPLALDSDDALSLLNGDGDIETQDTHASGAPNRRAQPHVAVQAWLVMSLLLCFPVLFALIDRESLHRAAAGAVTLEMMRVIMVAQGMVGIAALAAAVWSMVRQRIHGSLVLVGLIATAYATAVACWLMAVVEPAPATMYLPLTAPIVICASLTIFTWVARQRQTTT